MGRFQHSIHNITYLKGQIEVQKLIDGLSLHNIVIKYDTWMIKQSESQTNKQIKCASIPNLQFCPGDHQMI